MLFPEIDQRQTKKKVSAFFRSDYPRLKRLAGYNNLIGSPRLDGMPRAKNHRSPDDAFIDHASYAELFKAVTTAIKLCKSESQLIIKECEIRRLPLYRVAMDAGVSERTLYRDRLIACVEIADNLLVETSKLGQENVIELHVYKANSEGMVL